MIFFALSCICHIFSIGFFLLASYKISLILLLGGMLFAFINHIKNPIFSFYPEKMTEEEMEEIRKMIEELE